MNWISYQQQRFESSAINIDVIYATHGRKRWSQTKSSTRSEGGATGDEVRGARCEVRGVVETHSHARPVATVASHDILAQEYSALADVRDKARWKRRAKRKVRGARCVCGGVVPSPTAAG
jgi:hypothetical protein